MSEISTLTNLFKDLGTRLQTENNLSDMTWAIAKLSKTFMKAFINHLELPFQDNVPYFFYREISLNESCRPDFLFEQGNNRFIIENKIYDTNYHFEQYTSHREAKNITGFGIISNHKLDNISLEKAQKNNFKVAYWEDFIEGLKRNKFYDEEKMCIEAYIQYVKEVCSIMELKVIRFNELSSLYFLNGLITKIIHEYSFEGFECKFYPPPPRAHGNYWSGQYFSLNRKSGSSTVYPIFGIYFKEEPPVIYISCEKDWCKPIYEQYKGKKKGGISYNLDSDDWEVSFVLKEQRFNEFTKATLEQQKIILKEYFAEVIKKIANNL